MNAVRWFALLGCLALLATPASGQSACRDLMCPNGAPAEGKFPDACLCGLDPISLPAQTLSCQKAVTCNDPNFIPVGKWPACGCQRPDRPGEPSGDGNPNEAGFHPGAGGVKLCNDMFKCPPRFQMAEENDVCVCK